MRKINENVAYARSILSKQGITTDSPEYSDYLKIRQICGNSNGYVGILTKIRFVDGIDDMDEIESIFDILKDSKIDINKLNRMSYDEILEIFYDELSPKEDTKDLELIFKDEEYSYYRVYTYEGILKIGSPSWCLKTKSKWDEYQVEFDQQWVVINNEYKNRLLTPNNNYLSDYKTDKPWVRFGISLEINDDNSITWTGFSDNNNRITGSPDQWTSFGVLFTIFNLINDVKKSYSDQFRGCEKITGTDWHKVTDKRIFLERFKHSKFYSRINDSLYDEDGLYINFISPYNSSPVILVLNNYHIRSYFPISKSIDLTPTKVKGDNVKKIILDYTKDKDDVYFDGIKLVNGLITMEEIESKKSFLKKVGQWLIFNRNKDFYLIVNTDLKGEFTIPSSSIIDYSSAVNNPFVWYLNKETFKPESNDEVPIQDYHQEVIDVINAEKLAIIEPEPKKKVKGFWDFLKRK